MEKTRFIQLCALILITVQQVKWRFKSFENATTEISSKSAIQFFRDISTAKIANCEILSDIVDDKERTKTTFIQHFSGCHCTVYIQ